MSSASDGPARGWRRVRALRDRCAPGRRDAAMGGIQAEAPDAGLPEISGGFPITAALGLSTAGIPEAWIDALGWAGVPLASHGTLRWGHDLVPGAVELPRRAGQALLLPEPERLRACNGLELKPLRLLIASRVGYRLQAGPGVHLFAWDALAILVSCRELPLGGLLYGPRPGSRATVALEPGGVQVVRW